MTLFKRGNVWWAYVWIAGVRHQKSTSTSNRRQAERIGLAFEEELKMRRYRLPELQPTMTVEELAARFIAEGLAKAYSLDRIQHVLPYFGGMTLTEVDRASIRKYRQARHAASTVKVATVNRDISVLRRLMYFAAEEGYIPANPLTHLRLEREPRTKRPVLSVREEELLLAAASDHLRPIIICALDTGMRRGEILGQVWEDIDVDNQLLYVSHSKTPEGEKREIPLTTRLLKVLLNDQKAEGEVFTFNGDRLRNIKRTWATALRNARIRHIRFHDLRHTANTRLMLAGVMQEVRRELVGHTSQRSRDVNDRYTHVELPVKREAIRKLEAWHNAELARLTQTPDAQEQAPEPQPAA